ncbi:S8 family peptidase [Phaeodactylibacter xiamenensis]|uniref:S8 family peptidase n=1 Tax=Phaeodactylibacter xiamenensis TaxID=1524460 RepID=UPI0024A7BFC8|nr:S8 family serine peptidase [Phaeodactylibacter xiamenensis]
MKHFHRLLQKQAREHYKRQLEAGYDVVLPPEPVLPASQFYATTNTNYPIEKAQIGVFVKQVLKKHGIRRKVHIIVLDTGAKSRNKYIAKNFRDLGRDHTTDNNPWDEHGHFSFCASQVVGFNENPVGALRYPGVPDNWWSWSGEKLLNRGGSGMYAWISSGLEHALAIADQLKAQGQAVIISNSYGGRSRNQEVEDLFKAFRERGHFSFAAAGNSGQGGVNFPGNIMPDQLGEILFAIGAVDRNGQVAPFSSRGEGVDFMSYGVSNLGAGPGENEMRTGSGTSYSTPFAVGCTALLLGVFPEIENMADLEYVLTSGATDLGTPGKDKDYGRGLIRMDKFAEDDLPGDEPDEPDNPDEPGDEPDNPAPEPEMPLRRLAFLTEPGESFHVKWAVMDKTKAAAAGTLAAAPQLIDLDKPQASAYEWKSLYLRDVRVYLETDKTAAQVEQELIAFLRSHWPDGRRGVLLAPPADHQEGGWACMHFAKMFAKREGFAAYSMEAKCYLEGSPMHVSVQSTD